MKTPLLIFSIVISVSCFGQTFDRSRFIHINRPYQDDQFQKALATPPATNFAVSVVNGLLKINIFHFLPVKKYAYNSRTLLAINFGEVNGGLFYQPVNKNEDKIVVNGQQVRTDNRLGNFRFLLKDNDPAAAWLYGPDFLVLDNNIPDLIPDTSGCIFFVNDRQMDNGGLFRLVAQKDTITISQLAKFDRVAPLAISLSNNKIYLVTTRDFFIFNNSTGKVELELDNVFLNGSYPNSIAVVSESEVYIGMCSAFARINPQTKQFDFYLFQY